MSLSQEQLEHLLLRIDARDLSLDAPLHAESTTTFADRLTAIGDTEEDYDERQARTRLSVALSAVLPVLDRRERFIADSRWLADPESELSLADIGRELGISRERARQLETRARAKLRRALAERYGASAEWLPSAAA
jgi:RNA polymerase sigma-32 factor